MLYQYDTVKLAKAKLGLRKRQETRVSNFNPLALELDI